MLEKKLLFKKPFFWKKRFFERKKVFENKNIANDPKNEPQKKILFGEKPFLEIVFENFVLKKFFFNYGAPKNSGTYSAARLNVHAKSDGSISLSFADTKPGGVCCNKSKT